MADDKTLDDILAEDDPVVTDVVVIDEKDKKNDDKKEPSSEETIESLKAQIAERDIILAAEKDRSRKLEEEKLVANRTATTASEDAWKAHESSIENAINAAKTDLDSIKKQLKQARVSGDVDAEIDLEERLADAKYQFNAAEWEKKNLAAQKSERERVSKIEQANAQQPKPGTYSPKTQEWITKHPRFTADDEYNAAAIASHTVALRKGYQPDSDAYFEFINGRLAKQFADEEPPPRQSQSQSTAAPPSRTTSTSRMASNGKIRLTSDQIEAAEACGMSPAEYAADLMKIDEEKGKR